MELTMIDVVQALSLPVKMKRGSADMRCPECGGNTLHFDFKRNVFNCPRCSSLGGGVLDAWAYFRDIKDLNRKDQRHNAKIDIEEFFDSKEHYEGWIDSRKDENFALPEAREYEIANIEVRDYTYKELLKLLILEDKHKESLLARGLSEQDIEAYGFKSIPRANLTGLASSLLFKGCTLKGVPGFYQNRNNNWSFVCYGTGILIPEKNAKGQIQAFQARLDKGSPKYLTISSSSKFNGAAAKTFVHFASKNLEQNISKVILTEGPLKGDIINKYLNIPVLAIPGVNAINHLQMILPQLKEKGLKRVDIAFDMDFYSNVYVRKALIKMKRLLSDHNISYRQLIWDKEYKGMDDFLKALNER